VLRRLNNYADVSAPNYKITGLGLLDSLKSIHPGIELGRWSISVSESGLLVNRMDKMGAIRLVVSNAGIESRGN